MKFINKNLFAVFFALILIGNLSSAVFATRYASSRFLPLPSNADYYGFGSIGQIAVDSIGNVYATDMYGDKIIEFTHTGEFVKSFGINGSLPGQFNRPRAIALDSLNNIYVADSNNRIQKFNNSGEYMLEWGSTGSGDGQFQLPRGIVVDSVDNIFITDITLNNVQKFDSDGNFINKWGVTGSGDGEFNSPRSIAVDSLDKVYVADNLNNRVQRFTNNGAYETQWGVSGTGDGEFGETRGIAIDGDDNVYVTDVYNYRIQKFDSNGLYLSQWGGEYGAGDGQFSYPAFLAINSSGEIFVSENNAGRIQVFDTYGDFIKKWGVVGTGANEFNFIRDMAIDGSDYFFIVDTGNNRISEYDSDGILYTQWGSAGSGNGEFSKPLYVEVDNYGDILVTDSDNHRIQKFDSEGVFLSSFGSFGTGDGEFDQPYGITVDSLDNIFVVDRLNNRIQKFDSAGVYITQWGSAGSGNGQFNNPTGIDVDYNDFIYVVDSGNSRIQKFDNDGIYFDEFGENGSGNSQFIEPFNITFDSNDDLIYVVDTGNNRIQVFDISYNFLYQIGNGVGGSLPYELYGPRAIEHNSLGELFIAQTLGSENGLIQKWTLSNQITNIPASIDVLVNGLSFKTVGTSNSVDQLVEIKSGNNRIATVEVDMTSDRDWSLLEAGIDVNSDTVYVANLNPSDAPGAQTTHSLYVPQLTGQKYVFVCPGALSIADVNSNCPDVIRLDDGDFELSQETIYGQEYWRVDGLTGTGIKGMSTDSLSIVPNKTTVDVGEEIDIDVSALDIDGLVDPNYLGTVTFTSSSGTAILPSNFEFVSMNSGVYTFYGEVIFTESGDYTITVTDTIDGVLTATTSSIHVNDVTIADNDNFVDAIAVDLNTPIYTNNFGATVEVDEPGTDFTGGSLWWTYQSVASGPLTISLCGSDFDTTLSIYTGDLLDDLTLIIDNDDFEGCGVESQVTIDAIDGTNYKIKVGGLGDLNSWETGNIVLTLTDSLDTPTPTPTDTIIPTDTPIITDTPTVIPTDTEIPTNTPTMTSGATVTPTTTIVITNTPTVTTAATLIPTSTVGPTNTIRPTNTTHPTNTPTIIVTVTQISPTVSPTTVYITQQFTPTQRNNITPTVTQTVSLSELPQTGDDLYTIIIPTIFFAIFGGVGVFWILRKKS